jgi:ribosomal protein S18 acetylase RimI-like enzyme
MNPSDYQIAKEISDKQIDQLIDFSNSDDEILKYTNDQVRFGDSKSFDNWFSKGKQIFILTNKNQELLGIIWFSKKLITIDEYKNYGISFAVRIYGKARGKGFSKDFAKKAIKMLKQTEFYKNFPNKGIWLTTNHDNEIAKKVYGNLEFKKIKEDAGRITMILNTKSE